MNRRIRLVATAAIGTLVAGLMTALPAPAVAAGTSYTWTGGGAGDHAWTNPQNWSPQGVPGPDDSAVLVSDTGTTTVDVPAGGLGVADLAVHESRYNLYLQGGALTVTGAFDWTGGQITAPTAVAGTGRVGAGNLKYLRADLTVTGTLTLDDLGDDPDTALRIEAPKRIVVQPGATLRANGTNLVGYTGCCTAPARVVNGGTIDVGSGHTTLRAVQLDLSAGTTVQVARGATLTNSQGLARLGDGVRYAGGGTVEFSDTHTSSPDPKRPGDAFVGALLQGRNTLVGGTTLRFAPEADLSGVGSLAGSGTLRLTGAKVYARLSVQRGVSVAVSGEPSALRAWNDDLAGYHAQVTLGGTLTVARGTTLAADAGTTLAVSRGGVMRLAPGATYGTGGCCTRPAKLSTQAGGTLAVPAGKGAAAKLVRVDYVNAGTLALAAGKRLVTDGYRIKLGGTLKVTGKTKPGALRPVLTAEKVTGRFGCVRPAGHTAVYSTRTVSVTGVIGKFSGCATAVNKKLAARTVGAHQALSAKATKGVPAKARTVLLAVTVGKVKKATAIRVSGGAKFTAAGKSTVRYVVATRSKAKKVTVVNGGSAAARLAVVLLGAVR